MGGLYVTGFAPFVDAPHNPSAAVLKLLPAQLGGLPLRTRILPVDGAAIGPALTELWREQPEVVIHTGVAVDRSEVSLETQAINRLDYRIPDNAGAVRSGEITPEGPSHRRCRLPEASILNAWRIGQVPGARSHSAGTFLCNQTYYLSLGGLPERVPCGFLHLPPDETLGRISGRPGLPLVVLAEAIVLAALATLEAKR
ncbi:MAG: pyroglutamyl-peptidase I [Deltaproteobacteria bacterium]|jgi:pyroglutamyl-peptidase|nr:pyroglutamyl-peptidase I [Deltaproteobacteria bacterium]